MGERTVRACAALPAVAMSLMLAACITPYSMTKAIDPGQGLSVGEGVRMAARAMQAVGYFPTQQNDAQGHVIGERSDKDLFRTDVFTLYIDAKLSPSAAGGLQMKATCSISKNMAYTDQLDDECEKFQRAFDKLLGERARAGRSPVSTPGRVSPETRPPPPAAASAPAPAGPKGYSL
jgi:hypothetical protein